LSASSPLSASCTPRTSIINITARRAPVNGMLRTPLAAEIVCRRSSKSGLDETFLILRARKNPGVRPVELFASRRFVLPPLHASSIFSLRSRLLTRLVDTIYRSICPPLVDRFASRCTHTFFLFFPLATRIIRVDRTYSDYPLSLLPIHVATLLRDDRPAYARLIRRGTSFTFFQFMINFSHLLPLLSSRRVR